MPAAARTCVSFANFSKIGEPGLEVASGLHPAEVDVVAVGGDHVLAFAQRLVGDHVDRYPDRADRAARRAERLPNLLLLGRTELLAQRLEELHLVEPVVAAYQCKHDLR